tara:strand:+ start:2811 stop:4325 length:1515 start_codon:yes stop_codon:yes gene_type:complete
MNFAKFLLAILTIFSFSVNAQNEIDALRYSQQNMYGSARVSSMGGAFGSLGGDFSGLSQNPAGIGMYQFTEVTFSPSFTLKNTTSYNNKVLSNNNSTYSEKFKEDISQGNLGNIGFIFATPKDNTEWKRVNFGIGLNQLANYDRNIYINTINNSSSLADNLLSVAQGKQINDLDAFFGSPAFWSDIIDLENNTVDTSLNQYLFDNGNYISHILSEGQKRQTHQLNANGGMHEFVLSVGTSYEDRLYLGATVGIPTFEYSEIIKHREDILSDTINNLGSFEYMQNLYSTGEGVNIKIGGLFRINENIKLGGALHSPTVFTIQEEFKTITQSNFSDTSYREASPVNFFEYELTTPWKAIASISANINDNIIFSCDYEIIDYTNSSLNSKNYRNDDGTEIFSSENNTIDNIYHKSENIRLGIEMKADPFRLRAGYSRYSSPFKNNEELSRENFSFGAGINYGSYYFDFAYVLSQAHDQYQMYNEQFVNPTDLVYTDHNLVITLGFRY